MMANHHLLDWNINAFWTEILMMANHHLVDWNINDGYPTENSHWNFSEISQKYQWNNSPAFQDPNDKEIKKQEIFAMKNKQYLSQKLRCNTCICKLSP